MYNAPVPHITWGLIQGLKTKRGDSVTYILRQLLLNQKKEDFNYHNWKKGEYEEKHLVNN